ncbi:MAG: thymidine kinase [Candidatus Eisenbacteria bacterium]
MDGDVGWIEVICGSMFSGKSEELIRRLRRATIAKQKVQAFKPVIDDRYSPDDIVSHDERRIECLQIKRASDIAGLIEKDTKVVGIDEAQFFGDDLVELCEHLAESGRRVVVAGLDQDYRGKPFEPIPQLLALAESITKTMAVCMVCGAPANKTQRLIESDERIVVGAGEAYEPRCRKCYEPRESR